MSRLYQELARLHRQDLLDEAARRGLAAAARSARPRRAGGAGASALRRELGWAIVDLGVWLSGGGIESPVSPR